MPPHSLLDSSKRARNFISSRGYPRYCTITPASSTSGQPVITGSRSRRGKFRGHPASRSLRSALKAGGEDAHFLDFMSKLLDWDPATRLTPSQALRHIWLRRRLPKAPEVGGAGVGPAATAAVTTTGSTGAVHATTSNSTGKTANSGTTGVSKHSLSSIATNASNGGANGGAGGTGATAAAKKEQHHHDDRSKLPSIAS